MPSGWHAPVYASAVPQPFADHASRRSGFQADRRAYAGRLTPCDSRRPRPRGNTIPAPCRALSGPLWPWGRIPHGSVIVRVEYDVRAAGGTQTRKGGCPLGGVRNGRKSQPGGVLDRLAWTAFLLVRRPSLSLARLANMHTAEPRRAQRRRYGSLRSGGRYCHPMPCCH